MVQSNTKWFGNLILVRKNIRKAIITTIYRKTILIKKRGRWLYHNVRHCALWSTSCAICIMFTRSALKARSHVCLESPSDKEMSGKLILGPLPQKSCAPKIELCFDGPSSTALPPHPHTDPGEGRMEGMRCLSFSPQETAWQSIQGAAQVARAWSVCGATPTSRQRWAKWIHQGETPRMHLKVESYRLNRRDDS